MVPLGQEGLGNPEVQEGNEMDTSVLIVHLGLRQLLIECQ